MKSNYALPLVLAGLVALSGCSGDSTDHSHHTKEAESDSSISEEVPTEETESVELVETTTEEQQPVETNFEGISFVLPENAVPIDVGEQPLPVLAVFLDPATGTNLNVVAEPLTESMTVDEYIRYVIAASGVEFVSNETYTSNGFEWNETIREIQQDAGDMHLIQRTIIHDGIAYIFSYSGSEDIIQNDYETFNMICNSVAVGE